MRFSALMVMACLLPAAAGAQEPQSARFRLERTDSGFVRLDTQTGAITICRDEGGNLTCRMAADERAAYEEELDRLEKRVEALEEKLAVTPPAKALPGEAEIEQTLSIMERFMRRFMEIIEDFAAERETREPSPDRT